jgi:aryl-alcohol dehydrogenase-like predicted oxidoreductase
MDDEGVKKGASRAYVMSAAESSLRRLRTDWIDLYQMHTPDPGTPIEETLRALEDLIRDGKVRQVGCSNIAAEELEEAQNTAARTGIHGFVSSQEHYNLLTRGVERTLAPSLRRRRMGLIPFAPLASGLLSGKYRKGASLLAESRLAKSPRQAQRYLNDANWRIIDGLEAFCRARGRNLLSLALSWLAAQDLVPSVIAGAMTPEQADKNVDAAEWALSREELDAIDAITRAEQSAETNDGR